MDEPFENIDREKTHLHRDDIDSSTHLNELYTPIIKSSEPVTRGKILKDALQAPVYLGIGRMYLGLANCHPFESVSECYIPPIETAPFIVGKGLVLAGLYKAAKTGVNTYRYHQQQRHEWWFPQQK